MRTLRLFVGLSVVGAQIAATVVGCGGSDNNGTPPIAAADGSSTNPDGSSTGDGSTSNDGSTNPDTTVAPTITITAADVNVYLGQIAQTDASASTITPAQPVDYAWTVVSAPPGSAVNTTSLFNAGSAKPTFTPDVAGDYVLKVVVSGGGASSEKNVTVKASEAVAFYLYTEDDGGAPYRSGMRATPSVSDAGARSLSCHVDNDDTYAYQEFAAMFGSDTWEGPPGTPSRATYFQADKLADGGTSYVLFGVTSDSTCAAPPTKLTEFVIANDGNMYHPRFSPDGQRVAYIRNPDNPVGIRVATVGFDGSTPKTVAPYAALADGGPAPAASVAAGQNRLVSPRWVSNTQLGWLQLTTASAWQVVVADDVEGATASVFMRCASANAVSDGRPEQFAFGADGTVIVAIRTAAVDGGPAGARNIVVYKPNATTQQCEVVRNITQYADGGAAFSSASNFSISPDGRQIAYVSFDHTADAAATPPTANGIWIASIDGTTPPTPLPGAPLRGAVTDQGPRWLAGGALLAWPQVQRTVEAGAGDNLALVVASSGGGNQRVVANSTVGNDRRKIYGIGNGASCTIAAAGGSGLVGLGAAGAFAGLLIRRFRRRK